MEKSVDRVRSLMMGQGLAVLCTAQPDGQPYTSLIAVVAAEGLGQLGFATLRATRKFDNLSFEPRIALLLDDRTSEPSDLRQAASVTVLGRARTAEGAERELWADALRSRHGTLLGLLDSPDCALVVVEVERLLLVTRLQQVVELEVTGGVVQRVSSEIP